MDEKLERLPPWAEACKDFSVLHYRDVPEIDINKWRFSVRGFIKRPLKLSFHEFLSLPSIEIRAVFYCVTGWTKLDIRWKGVLFNTILEMAEPLPDARYVSIYAEDGYTTNLPLDVLIDKDVILQELRPKLGYPLRLILPKRYAYKSAKWVKGIEFLDKDKPVPGGEGF